MPFNINTFKAQGLIFGGARPTLFQCQFTAPPGVQLSTAATRRFTIACRSASLPGSSVDPIEVPYFGRRIKIAGDRTFSDWPVNVMNDEDFMVRAMFEKWSNSLNAMISNYRDTDGTDLENYKTDMLVTQYAKDGNEIRGYYLIGAWPTVVDSIDLDWDATNQIEQFAVNFAYDYWIPADDVRTLAEDQYSGVVNGDSN